MKNKKLLFYIIMIILGNLTSIIFGLIEKNASKMEYWQIIVMPIFGTAFVIIGNAIESLIIRKINPQSFKNPDLFCPGKKMIAYYEGIGIKKWKDKILELGGQTSSFSKAHIDEKNPEYFDKFIFESNLGILMHLIAMSLGLFLFLIHPFSSFRYNILNTVSVATFNAFLNYLPYCVLRYNLPRLKRIRELTLKKLERTKEKTNTE